MSELIDTTEMYLRTVYELIEEGIPPMRARIAERLHQSGPTVSQTVARMERDGLLTLAKDRRIVLTDEGQHLAEVVMRKHRLVERLLIDVIGLDWQLVHAEACRWEHVVSDEVERRLYGLLEDTSLSPYGNPIPGLEAFGATDEVPAFRDGNEPLSDLARQNGGSRVIIERMSEMVQSDDELIAELAAAGVRPGLEVILIDGPIMRVGLDSENTVPLPQWAADGLFGRLA
mgnify:CR=1 FL=1